jgi:hypothetical protein
MSVVCELLLSNTHSHTYRASGAGNGGAVAISVVHVPTSADSRIRVLVLTPQSAVTAPVPLSFPPHDHILIRITLCHGHCWRFRESAAEV